MPRRVISATPWRIQPAIWAGAGVGALATAAAVLLWDRYGGAVFFEMVASGLASCF
jgi:hypothetical protein